MIRTLVLAFLAPTFPQDAPPLLRARALLLERRLDEALAALDEAPAALRDSRAFLDLLSRVSLAKGEQGGRHGSLHFEEAGRALGLLLDREPSFEGAALLVRARLGAGDREGARDALALAERIGPGRGKGSLDPEPDARALARTLFLLADLAFRDGRLEDARDLFGLVTSLDPADPAAWNNRAFLCRQTGRYEDAWRAYLGALALRRDDPRLLNDAAIILHYNVGRDPHLARALYERAIECAGVLLLDPDASPTVRREALAARKDAEENLRRLLAGRRGPDPIEGG